MSPTRILLAQHDPIILEDLKEELQRQGYLVIGAVGDGASALRQARELRPDLVISCMIMPEMDGLTLAETLTRERGTPVLLCTAVVDDETRARARAAGVVSYLVKPWRQADLRHAIELALARYQAAGALAEHAATLEERRATRAVVEAAQVLLVARDHLDPGQAMRTMARAAMNTRRSLREVAEAILLADELERQADETGDQSN